MRFLAGLACWLVAAGLASANGLAIANPQTKSSENKWEAHTDRGNEEISDPAKRPRVVVVRPVILCDDDGSHPARYSLPKKLVDRVYTKADLEFVYLEPVSWHFGKARRGEVNLNQIVDQGVKTGMITKDRRIVTLLFVSAVDGRPGPLGRGLQNGNICFVTYGEKGAAADPAMRAFVVAHEVGHCLNLIHTVDDPKVPDDIPNLQGDGAYEDRLAVDGLHDTQRDTVLKSPLVMERIKFHSVQEGRQLICDETWEPYIAGATDEMLRFTMGLKADAALPGDPRVRLGFIFEKYREKVLAFTDDERRWIRKLVDELNDITGKKWPCMARLPWHFVKVDSSFCRGMAHTRGITIYLSDKYLERMANDEKTARSILLHEKLHVIQRLNPSRFESLYREYGFAPVELARGEIQKLSAAQNPDALKFDWAILNNGKPTMLFTVLKPGKTGHYEFETEYRALEEQTDGKFKVGAKLKDDDSFTEWKASLPLNTGHDHPNEVSAYILGSFWRRNFSRQSTEALSEPHAKRFQQTFDAFDKILRLDGN